MEARDLGVVNGVQSYLVESNRSGSAIDRDAPEDNNGRWSSEANLEMKRGDRVSVECVAIESTGASNSGATIEFTGKNITRGHEKLNFTDDQCVLEFNFYIVNNQHNTCNLPIRFNNDLIINYEDNATIKKPLNLTGFSPDGAGALDLSLNPIVGGATPIAGGQSSHSYTRYQQQVNKGYWGGISEQWGVSNNGGTVTPSPKDQPPTPLQDPTIKSPCDYQFPGCGFTSQGGYNFARTVLIGGIGVKIPSAYDLYQLRYNAGPGVPTVILPFPVPPGSLYNEIVISRPGDPGVGLATSNLTIIYDPETIPMPQDYNFGGVNLPFGQGMRVAFGLNSVLPPALPEVAIDISSPIISVESDIDNYLQFRTRAVIKVAPTNVGITAIPVNAQLICIINREPPINGEIKKTYGGYSSKPSLFDNGDGTNRSDYQKQGRMGIGLYNQSASNMVSATYTPNEPPPPATPAYEADAGGVPMVNDQAKRWLNMRGGSVLWEQARDYTAWGNADNRQMPQEGVNRNGTVDGNGLAGNAAKSGQGLLPRTCDMRNFKDNSPYILTRPDFMGPQPHPNGLGLCPKLEPLSCFVHVKAASAFEDVSALAAIFTEAFHAINKLLTGTGNQIQKYINESSYPFNKKSQVFPLFSEGWFSAYAAGSSNTQSGPTADNQPVLFKKIAKWNKSAPMWLGNCVKCIPANLDIGTDWKYQEGSPYFYWINDLRDYLKAGSKNDWLWDNQIYGNMALKDMNNCRAGDYLCRLEVWDGNTAIHANRDIARPVILNTQLEKQRLTTINQGWKVNLEPPPLPLPPPANQEYFGQTDNISEAPPFQFWGSKLLVGDIIFTNVEYQNTGWENMEGADTLEKSGYAPGATTEQIAAIRLVRYKNLDDIQTAMRMNEKYMIENNPYVINGQKNQQSQPWWQYSMDVGMSDCSQRLNSNQIGAGQPLVQPPDVFPGPPPAVYPVGMYNGLGSAADGRLGIMTPIQTNWTQEYPASADAAPFPIASKPYYAGIKPTLAPLQTDTQAVPAPISQTQFDLPKGSTFITPSQCIAGMGIEIDYQQATTCGKIDVFSKWNPQWEIPVLEQQAQAPWQNTYVPYNRHEGGPPVGAVCRFLDYAAPYPWLYDYTESKKRNIGAFPYRYYDEDGTEHELIAWCVSKEHNAISSGGDAVIPIPLTYQNASATWTLGDITWGDFFGFSPAFGYDQPALIPVNNDVITFQNSVTWTDLSGGALPQEDNVNPNTSHKANNVNHVWVGANNASMVFDQAKNRFELGGLYTSNTFSTLNAQTAPLAVGAIANSQIGEQVATLNGNDNDTILAANQNQPIGTKQNAGQGTHQGQTIPGVYDWDKRNQGVQDSVTGICLANIYHCPVNWIPPEELNPQNLTSPYMNNSSIDDGITDPYSRNAETFVQDFKNETEENYKTFKDTLTLATADNWQGTILSKMGFDYEQLIPYVGSQNNRYSQWTYGKSDITVQEQGVKPLILNAELDTSATLDLNTYHQRASAKTSMTGSFQQPKTLGPFPTYGGPYAEGTPLYRTGTLNNDTIQLDASIGAVLTARNQPSLYACPYYIIMTNLVSTTFQKGKMAQNAIYYGLKSYSAGQYFYVYASGYSQLVQADRLVQSITTELRNPLTGEIARVGPNSSIIYKIDRDVSLPPITMTADGQPVHIPDAIAQGTEEDKQLISEMEKIFVQEKQSNASLVSIKDYIGQEKAQAKTSTHEQLHEERNIEQQVVRNRISIHQDLETKGTDNEHHSTNWRTRQSRKGTLREVGENKEQEEELETKEAKNDREDREYEEYERRELAKMGKDEEKGRRARLNQEINAGGQFRKLTPDMDAYYTQGPTKSELREEIRYQAGRKPSKAELERQTSEEADLSFKNRARIRREKGIEQREMIARRLRSEQQAGGAGGTSKPDKSKDDEPKDKE